MAGLPLAAQAAQSSVFRSPGPIASALGLLLAFAPLVLLEAELAQSAWQTQLQGHVLLDLGLASLLLSSASLLGHAEDSARRPLHQHSLVDMFGNCPNF